MRIAACTVVAVVGISLEAVAQPSAHAHGKANAYAYGHAKRSDFAANDFKIGLPQATESSSAVASPSRAARTETPVVQIELPQAPQPSPGKKPIPDCIAR